MPEFESNTFLEVLRDFVRRADLIDLPFMVTGSFAMSAYGEARFTRDIDIVIEINERQAERFFKTFDGDYYVSANSITRAITHQSMFNIIHIDSAVKLDCIIRKSTDFEKQKFDRRRKTQVKDIEFWTTTKEDLILSKLNWARETFSEMQINDIANLISDEYDKGYVDLWRDRLELHEIWQRVLEWKTQHER